MPETQARPTLWFVRHGETAWSASGRHTSRTDLPLTPEGEKEAVALKPLLEGEDFRLVESSPLERALRTASLAGYEPVVDSDLCEWDYGDLEGLTTPEIRGRFPGWSIWDGPWPGGEEPGHVAARANRVVAKVLAIGRGRALLFSHGHFLRVLTACWLGRPPTDGRLFVLGTGTVCVLGWEHGSPAVAYWNVPPSFPPNDPRSAAA
jgi:broad specificity phosphatase PhoE